MKNKRKINNTNIRECTYNKLLRHWANQVGSFVHDCESQEKCTAGDGEGRTPFNECIVERKHAVADFALWGTVKAHWPQELAGQSGTDTNVAQDE